MDISLWISVIGMAVIFTILVVYSIYNEKRDQKHDRRFGREIDAENERRGRR